MVARHRTEASNWYKADVKPIKSVKFTEDWVLYYFSAEPQDVPGFPMVKSATAYAGAMRCSVLNAGMVLPEVLCRRERACRLPQWYPGTPDPLWYYAHLLVNARC